MVENGKWQTGSKFVDFERVVALEMGREMTVADAQELVRILNLYEAAPVICGD